MKSLDQLGIELTAGNVISNATRGVLPEIQPDRQGDGGIHRAWDRFYDSKGLAPPPIMSPKPSVTKRARPETAPIHRDSDRTVLQGYDADFRNAAAASPACDDVDLNPCFALLTGVRARFPHPPRAWHITS